MFAVIVLVLQAQAPPAPAGDLPVSLERIRKGLEAPPSATVVVAEPGMPPRYRVTVQEKLDIERLWREDLPVPSFVRPPRGLVHDEFVAAVTPDLFRGTVQYPCCNVLSAIEALGSAIARGARKRAESRVRREIKKELEALEEARRKARASEKRDR